MVTRKISTWGVLLAAALATATGPAALGQSGGGDDSARAPKCRGKWRGLGIEKVKAGDEHCGLLSRERKDTALDAACVLAETHRQELREKAEKRAASKRGEKREREGCRCEGEHRPWQNVYTHVMSQRCWTECGWAYLIECARVTEDDGAGDEPPGD